MWIDGSYVAPLRAVNDGIRGRTHIAQLKFGTRISTAYVKAFEVGHDRLLFNEVAGGMIARHAGIGAPAGGLVWVPVDVLQALFAEGKFAHHQGMVPCYASAPIDDGYGLAAVGLWDSSGQVIDTVREWLLAWPGFAACVAYDEWVANVDRHTNNILVGRGRRLIPIDHSDCFGGPRQRDEDFEAPHAWYRNRLLDEVFIPDQLTLPTKTALAHAANMLPACLARCTAELSDLRPWLGEPLGLNWMNWLLVRADNTAQWMRERVRLLV